MSRGFEYLDIDDLLELARRLLGEPVPLRDAGLLGAAAARPQASAFGEDAYPDVWAKAAALLHSVVSSHPLIDGNKRLGWLSAAVFLELNGAGVSTAPNDAVYDLVMAVATGARSVDDIAAALRLMHEQEPHIQRTDLLGVVRSLADEVAKNPHVHAMWIEGSYATGEHTDQSDIDVWLDVDDGSFESCVQDFRLKLQALVEIERETTQGIYCDSPKLMKQTFVLRGFPEGQNIELDLQEHSRQFRFSRDHHVIEVLFDKDQTIQWETEHSHPTEASTVKG